MKGQLQLYASYRIVIHILGLYARVSSLKEVNPSLKILLAVGGWVVGSTPFIPVVRTRRSRKKFARNVVQYLRRHRMDGLDVDWEFPATRGSPKEDKHRFTLLLQDLQETFRRDAEDTGRVKLQLTLATAAAKYYTNKAYEEEMIYR